MKKYIPIIVAMLFLLSSVQAFAKPVMTVKMKAEKEVTVNKVTKKVAADKIVPGDMIFYTVNYVNSGDEPATNAVIDDPIPKGATYIAGSAFGDNADITFSIDGGKTFKQPSLLTYKVKQASGKEEKMSASPEKYTHVRWIIKSVPAGGKGQVGFQVLVK